MTMEDIRKNPEVMQIIGAQIGEFMHQRIEQDKIEKAKNYRLLNSFAQKGQILFTGSSLMEQFPVAEIAQSRNLGKAVYNRGIGGYTTDDFLAEIDTVLFDLEPSKIFINIGTNDINEHTFGSDWKGHLLKNYDAILNQIAERLPNAEVYMMAYYPVNVTVANEDVRRFMLATRTNAAIRDMNTEVQKLAAQHGFYYIDANEGLLDSNGELKAEFTKEGVHMFANAYEIVYHNLEQYL